MPRLFFAVKTPQPLVKELVALQDRLANELRALPSAQARAHAWPVPNLRPEQLLNSHCTLRFLGNVDESRIDTMVSAVRRENDSARVSPFEASLAKCGVFASRGKARVFWIGLSPEAPFLQLRAAIERGLKASGILLDDERAFHPHLTLFRFREPYRLPSNFELPPFAANSPTAPIHEAVLVESKTLAEGPVHTVRATFPF